MTEYSAFDIIGPIMVGPSSSHTAGACRIANTAINISKEKFLKVEFYLHGSFAHTYKGHGTDRALVAGIMGIKPDDDRLIRAFEIARENNLNYEIKTVDLGDKYHPNTVKIIFHYANKREEIIGSSIGGGSIVIVSINDIEVEFRGKYPTLLLRYKEQKGIIAYVSSILSNNNYNIETMTTKKDTLNDIVTLSVELEEELEEDIKNQILNYEKFISSKYVGV